MEFYKFTIFLKRMTKFVSIPNRMEFYGGNAMFAFFEFTSFQFPTGWNSTLIHLIRAVKHISFQFLTGWNSTLVYRHQSKVYL